MENIRFDKKRAFLISVLFGLLCSVFMSFARFDASCEELRHNILRLHIIANSNTDADQSLKLKVRDAILEESGEMFEGVSSLAAAESCAKENTAKIEEIANRVIKENGFDYKAKAIVGNSYFETREYTDFTLPAGNYPSLIVTLGEGSGKNWWCVVFPEVCIPAAAKAKLSDSVDKKSAAIADNPEGFVIRFKIVEIYEDIKNFLIR